MRFVFPKKKKLHEQTFFSQDHFFFFLQREPFFFQEKKQPFFVQYEKPFGISLKTSSKDVFLKGF